jgi:hypothetical protein
MKPSQILSALTSAMVLSACQPAGQSLGTAPSHPVSSITGLSNTGASNPDPGIKPATHVKIDTGIDPYADKKGR